MKSKILCPSLIAVAALVAGTATSFADRKITVRRDLDRDGHYNRKTYEVRHHYYPGYYRPYFGWYGSHYYPRTSVGLGVYDSPRTSRYSSTERLAVEVQRALRSRGYYGGPIDGEIGAGSQSAIRAYQRERGLGVTGRIDTALLRSLKIG